MRTKTLIHSLVFFALGAVLSGCNVSGDVIDMTVKETQTSIGQLSGITSGGSITTTSGNYQFQASLGEPISAIQSTTTSGYTVYSNVSGDMATQSSITTYH
jgi:hypothetical protein